MKIQNEKSLYMNKRIRRLNQHFSEHKTETWKASSNYGIKNSDSNKSIKMVFRGSYNNSVDSLLWFYI